MYIIKLYNDYMEGLKINRKRLVSIVLCLFLISSLRFTFADDIGLVIRNNKIISLPEGLFSTPSFKIYSTNGKLINEYDNMPMSVILKRTNDFILFESQRGSTDCDVDLFDFNTGKLKVLGNGVCSYFLVSNKGIYLELHDYASDKDQDVVTDIHGNSIGEEDNNFDSLVWDTKNLIDADNYENDKTQNEATKNIIKTENGVTFKRNLIQFDDERIEFLYQFDDSSHKSKISNLHGISAWTSDKNYIYYIQGVPMGEGGYSTFYRYDRNKKNYLSKEIYIKDCKGLHLYNGKLLFNGSGYYSYKNNANIYNNSIFIMDINGTNVHVFNDKKEVPLE